METTSKTEKRFPGELSVNFGELLSGIERKGPLALTFSRALIFVLQPFLGALPHQPKKDLERAVGNSVCFGTAGATGLNVLLNMVLYPCVLMGFAAAVAGVEILFSQRINGYILMGLFLAFLEATYRLREGIFQAKPPAEMNFGAAIYGIPLSYAIGPVLKRRAGILRSAHVPVDGFYGRGFIEKLERERRYGNVYMLEDLGPAYFLRLEFPTRVPDIGLPVRSELPDEMPDYDYDLLLKDGHFIVKGKCPEERIRKISSSVGAFPPEFTTVIPLSERIEGFSHRYVNKILEVLLVKEKTKERETTSL